MSTVYHTTAMTYHDIAEKKLHSLCSLFLCTMPKVHKMCIFA